MTMMEMVELLSDVSAAVTPIKWCTPRGVAHVTASVKEAAMSDRRRTVALDLAYPEVPDRQITGMISEARRHLAAAHPALTRDLTEHLVSLEDAVTTIAGRDDHQFSSWSLRRHGLPTREVVDVAGETLRAPARVEDGPKDRTAQDFAAAVLTALTSYDLTGWQVLIEERLAKVSVDSPNRQVIIRTDARLSAADVDRLLVHEVGGHVLRSENATAQPEPIAAIPIGDAVPTEEGLACWWEEQAQVASAELRRVYAARVLAVDLSASNGVLEVVRALAPAVGWDDAVAVAIRAKRGLHDFNEPGGYTKDHAYLSGLLAVRDALVSKPGRRAVLMATRWPLDMTATAEQLLDSGDLVPPARLPDLDKLGVETRRAHL